jgi:YD repeat-containing protein
MPSPAKWQAFLRFCFFLIRSLIGPPSLHALYPTQQVLGRTHVRQWPIRWFVLLGLFFLLQPAPHVHAQQPVIHYVYDDLGRLVGVVDPDGNAATYTYDAVGNILAIGRHNVADTTGPVAITLVSPNKGKVETAVSIFGKGFSPDPAQNSISFNGGLATVMTATSNSLTTLVPSGAFTGPITVATPLGTATSPEPFTVLGVVTISPTSGVLFPIQTQQFTATVSGTTTPSVTWSVNGIVGGNATIGTISAAGLYTAPIAVPSPPSLTVTATNTNDPSLFDLATVVIVAPPDKILAHPVSLAFAAPTTITVNALTAPALSVGFAAPTIITVNSLTARPISVSVATPPSTTVNALVAQAVSVGFAASTTQTAFLTASPVGVTLQPVITSVTPSSGARGVAGLSVFLTGAGITGATSVSFHLNGSNDANLSVTDLAASPDGTQATCTLAIGSGAVPGPRVVRITTPGGTSTASGTGGNLFTVQ